MSSNRATFLESRDADGAVASTLDAVLSKGHDVVAGKSLSTGSEQGTKEILNFSVALEHPRARLTQNPVRRLNLPAAVARFVWMMAGSDRLADIVFYEEKAKYFTDDGISMPGSNYGQRILQPRPGLNQLSAVIERLKEDGGSRRAAISVYQAEDSSRQSKDIPCTFGLFYYLREGQLHSTTLMRSNNATVLLPYNIFEFSLLAEIVAAELEVPLGTLVHTAISMHIYSRDAGKAADVVAAYDSNWALDPMHTMPFGPKKPLAQVKELVILEAALRHGSEGVTGHNINDWIQRGSEKLDPYWKQFYLLLLLYVVKHKSTYLKVHADEARLALDTLQAEINPYFKRYLDTDSFVHQGAEAANIQELLQLELPWDTVGAKIIPLHKTVLHKSLQKHAAAYEAEHQTQVGWKEFVELEERFAGSLAAQGNREISAAEFAMAMKDLRT